MTSSRRWTTWAAAPSGVLPTVCSSILFGWWDARGPLHCTISFSASALVLPANFPSPRHYFHLPALPAAAPPPPLWAGWWPAPATSSSSSPLSTCPRRPLPLPPTRRLLPAPAPVPPTCLLWPPHERLSDTACAAIACPCCAQHKTQSTTCVSCRPWLFNSVFHRSGHGVQVHLFRRIEVAIQFVCLFRPTVSKESTLFQLFHGVPAPGNPRELPRLPAPSPAPSIHCLPTPDYPRIHSPLQPQGTICPQESSALLSHPHFSPSHAPPFPATRHSPFQESFLPTLLQGTSSAFTPGLCGLSVKQFRVTSSRVAVMSCRVESGSAGPAGQSGKQVRKQETGELHGVMGLGGIRGRGREKDGKKEERVGESCKAAWHAAEQCNQAGCHGPVSRTGGCLRCCLLAGRPNQPQLPKPAQACRRRSATRMRCSLASWRPEQHGAYMPMTYICQWLLLTQACRRRSATRMGCVSLVQQASRDESLLNRRSYTVEGACSADQTSTGLLLDVVPRFKQTGCWLAGY